MRNTPHSQSARCSPNDDYSSWGAWDHGELAGLGRDELRDEFRSFRGDAWARRALRWVETNRFPPVVIFPEESLVGDGRGRISVAVGLDRHSLPVILLTRKRRRTNPTQKRVSVREIMRKAMK